MILKIINHKNRWLNKIGEILLILTMSIVVLTNWMNNQIDDFEHFNLDWSNLYSWVVITSAANIVIGIIWAPDNLEIILKFCVFIWEILLK